VPVRDACRVSTGNPGADGPPGRRAVPVAATTGGDEGEGAADPDTAEVGAASDPPHPVTATATAEEALKRKSRRFMARRR